MQAGHENNEILRRFRSKRPAPAPVTVNNSRRSLATETQQVWDFAGDGFVHRLIHNKADGKLVEISDPGQTSEERPQMPARLSDVQAR